MNTLKSRAPAIALSLLSLSLLLGADKGGCGEGLDNRAGDPGIEVGGVLGAFWKMSYADQVVVRVRNGGALVATKTLSLAAGGTFDVGGVTVDLSKLCARADVACPSEVFPAVVKMTQPGSDQHLLYVTFNKVGPLGSLGDTTLLGNVDSDDDFSIALGIGAAGIGSCGLLSLSYATGHIDNNGVDLVRGVSLTGRIVTEYAGGCVVSGTGGTVAAGLTVEIDLPITAVRGQ
jgi:hypothetical protein